VLCTLCALAIFARTGWFDWRLPACAPIVAAVFAVLYAVSCLAAVAFENGIVAIFVALIFWVGCWGVGVARNELPAIGEVAGERLELPPALARSVEVAYQVLPKTREAGHLIERLLLQGREPPALAAPSAKLRPEIDIAASAASSAAFVIVILAIACLVFARRDY